MNTPKRKPKSVWVLAVVSISYEDIYYPSPHIEIQAVGTYGNCIKALKESIREEASSYWEGTSNFNECVQSEIDEVMASREDYSPSIKEWEMYHSSRIVCWRLQKKTQK